MTLQVITNPVLELLDRINARLAEIGDPRRICLVTPEIKPLLMPEMRRTFGRYMQVTFDRDGQIYGVRRGNPSALARELGIDDGYQQSL